MFPLQLFYDQIQADHFPIKGKVLSQGLQRDGIAGGGGSSMGLKRRKGERERFHIRGSTRKRMGVQGHYRENKKEGGEVPFQWLHKDGRRWNFSSRGSARMVGKGGGVPSRASIKMVEREGSLQRAPQGGSISSRGSQGEKGKREGYLLGAFHGEEGEVLFQEILRE